MKVYDYRNTYKNLDRNARKSVNNESYIVDLGDGRAFMVKRVSAAVNKIRMRLAYTSDFTAAFNSVNIDDRYLSPSNILKVLSDGGMLRMTAKIRNVGSSFILPSSIGSFDCVRTLLNPDVATIGCSGDEFSELAIKSFSEIPNYFDSNANSIVVNPMMQDSDVSKLLNCDDVDQIAKAIGGKDFRMHFVVNLYTGVSQLSMQESNDIVKSLGAIKSMISKKKSALDRSQTPMHMKIEFADGVAHYDSRRDVIVGEMCEFDACNKFYSAISDNIRDKYLSDLADVQLHCESEYVVERVSEAWSQIKPQLLEACRSDYRDFVRSGTSDSVKRLVDEMTKIECDLDQSIDRLKAMSNIGVKVDTSSYIVPITDVVEYVDNAEFVGDYNWPCNSEPNAEDLPIDVKMLAESLINDFSSQCSDVDLSRYEIDRLSKLSDSKFSFNLYVLASGSGFAEYRSPRHNVAIRRSLTGGFNDLYFNCSIDIDRNIVECKRVYDSIENYSSGRRTSSLVFVNGNLVFDSVEYCGSDSIYEYLQAVGLDVDAIIDEIRTNFESDRMTIDDDQLFDLLVRRLEWAIQELPMQIHQYHPDPNESYELSRFQLV